MNFNHSNATMPDLAEFITIKEVPAPPCPSIDQVGAHIVPEGEYIAP